MRELTQLMGMRRVFSIVDKHSNGVERVNKQVVRQLRSMVFDRNVRDVFDDPTIIIPSVQYILNTHVSSETGYPLLNSPSEVWTRSTMRFSKTVLSDLLMRSCNDKMRTSRSCVKLVPNTNRPSCENAFQTSPHHLSISIKLVI
jgi:hypothetical protein